MENFEKNEKKMRKLSHHFVVIMVIFVKEKLLFMVQIGGLEPPQIALYAPQAYVSTNSTISAFFIWVCRFSQPEGRTIAKTPLGLRESKDLLTK